MQFNKINKNHGVALLYAVLLVSIVLTISLSLMNITYKQIILTAVNKESQVAHFNAWSAVDCIEKTNRSFKILGSFNESDGNPFGYFTFDPSPTDLSVGTPDSTFTCGGGIGRQIDATVNGGVPTLVTNSPLGLVYIFSSYKLMGTGLNNACAIVDVAKVLSGNYADFPGEATGESDAEFTMVSVRGYNSLAPCAGWTSSRLVERRIRKRL